jgi:predicted transposase YbfD/YdcC
VSTSIAAHFRRVPDPRVRRTRRHALDAILVITLCAVICGADDWVAIARFGRAKRKWFRGLVTLPRGIPSHDTFGRVFAALDPEAFKAAFLAWVQTVAALLPGEVIAVDGKTLRRTFDTAADQAAIHMVSAWATAQGLCLGQVKTDTKSNEITAIPKHLDVLALTGRVVTIDAICCQTAIARRLHAKDADYVLSLKGNQTRLHDDIRTFFADATSRAFRDLPHTTAETVDGGHGRIEVRRAWATDDLAWLADRRRWPGLCSVLRVDSERTLGDHTTRGTRLFFSSLAPDAAHLARIVRSHWAIENGRHWVLDVAMHQDQTRIRTGHAPEHLAILDHLALNLLKQKQTERLGSKTNAWPPAGTTTTYCASSWARSIKMRLPWRQRSRCHADVPSTR